MDKVTEALKSWQEGNRAPWVERILSEAFITERAAREAAEAEVKNLRGKSSGKCSHDVDTFSSRGCYNCVLNDIELLEAKLARVINIVDDMGRTECTCGADIDGSDGHFNAGCFYHELMDAAKEKKS